MGSKNISISDEAYLRLAELKSKNESFTDIIYRLTKKTNILDLQGIINYHEGKSIENNIKISRKLSMDKIDKITEEFNK
ncbi:MAG: antitoxin VapB family protein [Thermoplasmataceae archaeon]